MIVIRALADTVLEGDEHFSLRLFPAESGAVIDPLNGERVSAFTQYGLIEKHTHYNIITRL